jgi:CRISPR/Cas system-associated endoribonuclease Cas2
MKNVHRTQSSTAEGTIPTNKGQKLEERVGRI